MGNPNHPKPHCAWKVLLYRTKSNGFSKVFARGRRNGAAGASRKIVADILRPRNRISRWNCRVFARDTGHANIKRRDHYDNHHDPLNDPRHDPFDIARCTDDCSVGGIQPSLCRATCFDNSRGHVCQDAYEGSQQSCVLYWASFDLLRPNLHAPWSSRFSDADAVCAGRL